MTPAALARLHALAFRTPPPWSAGAFADLLNGPGVFLLTADGGFLLARAVADEAEILTLAVDPARRRQGIARRLLADFDAGATARGAVRAFLEVAADNAPARALYLGAGWHQIGIRKGYVRRPDGPDIDALILTRDPSAVPSLG